MADRAIVVDDGRIAHDTGGLRGATGGGGPPPPGPPPAPR
jgi:hypothetical protein